MNEFLAEPAVRAAPYVAAVNERKVDGYSSVVRRDAARGTTDRQL